MLGYFAWTLRLIVASSLGEACCAPLASAFLALAAVSIGYEPGPLPPAPLPLPGSANEVLGNDFRFAVVI